MTYDLDATNPLDAALGQRPHHTSRLRRGYRASEVDAFLRFARGAGPRGTLQSSQVRAVGFGSQLGGYDVRATDSILARIEDVLADRERARARTPEDQRVFTERAAALSAAIRGRLKEPGGERFPRERGLRRGYRPSDVDALCILLAGHLNGRGRLVAADVRGALFRPRRGRRAYREAPVDAFFDRVVELMVTFDR